MWIGAVDIEHVRHRDPIGAEHPRVGRVLDFKDPTSHVFVVPRQELGNVVSIEGHAAVDAPDRADRRKPAEVAELHGPDSLSVESRQQLGDLAIDAVQFGLQGGPARHKVLLVFLLFDDEAFFREQQGLGVRLERGTVLRVDPFRQSRVCALLNGALIHRSPSHAIPKERLWQHGAREPALQRRRPEVDFLMPVQALIEATDGCPQLAPEHR